MNETNHEIWHGVSEERIERSKAFFDRTARLAWSYSCSILIGCPKTSSVDTSSGSGVFIKIANDYFVLTARHVVTGYEKMLAERKHAHFQIGQLTLCPSCRLVYDDVANDLAVLAIAPTEVADVGSTPYVTNEYWPRPLLKPGQHIQFCGYARINRLDGEAGEVNSTVLPLIAEINSCDDTHFSVVVEREKYRWNGDCLLRPDQKFLGGMSGGPALLLNDPGFPLIGIVYFRRTSLVPWLALLS
jgi:Trypsin-like peptidase domain